ncbi:Microsomal glutathione S-transferase 3 [Grifola frondosa]|uniref:Microsomal glutathione S-transferase 3 n=1 Tax=Grifola frondosa TaxID=5627 RepID=A0A1C7MQ30_GRIFR|nr:Microsomal glutathione S-transferase 3 [Grifola frondosa]
MSSGIVLPKEFGYPAAAIVSSFYLMMWQTIRVGRARKVAGVEYPQVYAEKAEAAASKQAHLFNCAQRAHQSTLEFAPIILTGTLITGLSFPRVAASLCGLWTIARVFYTSDTALAIRPSATSLGLDYLTRFLRSAPLSGPLLALFR